MTTDIDRARQRLQHGPTIADVRKSLPDMAESLNTAVLELERDFTTGRLDRTYDIFTAATQTLVYLRQALEIEQHGTGQAQQ